MYGLSNDTNTNDIEFEGHFCCYELTSDKTRRAILLQQQSFLSYLMLWWITKILSYLKIIGATTCPGIAYVKTAASGSWIANPQTSPVRHLISFHHTCCTLQLLDYCCCCWNQINWAEREREREREQYRQPESGTISLTNHSAQINAIPRFIARTVRSV